MKAVWNGAVIAESKETINIEGNYYFPPQSVKKDYLAPSDTQSLCPMKGLANYNSVVVDGQENRDAAWYYSNPKEAAKEIRDYIAFWKGVEILP